ncbi:MAG TPA: MFS transporter, partial [Clostridia bacterium]|nr:MFS transporter [Clostridia bacterium]
ERGTASVGFVSLAVGCALMPLTTSFGQMLCLQALCGVGVGCVAPLMLALSGRRIDASLQGIAMGAHQSLYGIGMFVGPILAGWLMEVGSHGMDGLLVFGYRAVFLCAAGMGALGAILSMFLPQRRPQ